MYSYGYFASGSMILASLLSWLGMGVPPRELCYGKFLCGGCV